MRRRPGRRTKDCGKIEKRKHEKEEEGAIEMEKRRKENLKKDDSEPTVLERCRTMLVGDLYPWVVKSRI